MAIDHTARAEKAWPILVSRAKNGGPPYTYGELCTLLGLHPRAARYFLGVIQRYCRQNKLPPLQALVVNKSTRLPGSGYVGSPRTHADHNRALARVYQYKWSLKVPSLENYRK